MGLPQPGNLKHQRKSLRQPREGTQLPKAPRQFGAKWGRRPGPASQQVLPTPWPGTGPGTGTETSCGVTRNAPWPQDPGVLCLGSRPPRRHGEPVADLPPAPPPRDGRQLTDIGHVEPVAEQDRHDGHRSSRNLPLQRLESFKDLLILGRQLVLRNTLEAIVGGQSRPGALAATSPSSAPLKSELLGPSQEGGWPQLQAGSFQESHTRPNWSRQP